MPEINQLTSYSRRDRAIICGLFLSRFDQKALAVLGFATFTQAFNTLGYCTGNKPASIKNYRDEFDPHFDNPRKGWHKRKLRDHCKALLNAQGDLGFGEFVDLVKSTVYHYPEIDRLNEEIESAGDGATTYAKRLLTGQAAERYFVENYTEISEFSDCSIVDMTRSGCGFDFKLESTAFESFLAVEVKGLAGKSGNVSFTEKEWRVADKLGERYFVYLVKNFSETPFPTLFHSPLVSSLQAKRKQTMVAQISWDAAD